LLLAEDGVALGSLHFLITNSLFISSQNYCEELNEEAAGRLTK